MGAITRGFANNITTGGSILRSGLDNASFFVELTGSNQSITSASLTKIQYNTTRIDTESAWSGASNYEYTIPLAGKWCIMMSANAYSSSNNIQDTRMELFKNGSRLQMKQWYSFSADHRHQPVQLTGIFDLSVGDDLTGHLLINATSPEVRADGSETWLAGFLVG